MGGIDINLLGSPVTLNVPCIYRIVNLITGECYIGSSWTGTDRVRTHFSKLKRGKHHSPYLQRSFNKHGIGTFQVDYLRTFRPDEMTRTALYRLEQQYMDNLKPAFNGLKKVFHHGLPPEERREASTRRVQTYIVTSPKGNTSTVTNLTAFCRERGLRPNNMSDVARGVVSHHKGWRCAYADGSSPIYRQRNKRDWVATDPTGKDYVFTNLSAFCREHALSVEGLFAVARGVMSQSKGWKCRYAEDAVARYVKRPYGPKPKNL